MKLIATCAFGLEAIVKRELTALGYHPKTVSPGRIGFSGDWESVCQANLWLRTADRVLVEIQNFPAPDFDGLFESVKAFDWSQYIPVDGEFPVVARSRASQLTSVPAIQRSVKKALVESLRKHHQVQLLPESAGKYKVEAALLNDHATLTIDTTGPSLHKRGYRKLSAAAPIKETLAAALVSLSVWNEGRLLADPFCGSGTIAIEAAMLARDIAPGLKRAFASSAWPVIHQRLWDQARQQAKERRRPNLPLEIVATDRDSEVLSLAGYHARQAGVADGIRFAQRSFQDFQSDQAYGCIVTNPPYGERLEDQERLIGLYECIPEIMQRLPTWSLFLITNMPRFESLIQKQATRRRKLYNGRIQCTYFQFLGPKPPSMVRQRPKGVAGQQQPSVTVEAIDSQAQPTQPPAVVVFGAIDEHDRRQAELFKTRLTKRARHFRRWPTKRGITCFRLYERDIPEIPLVVDRYENFLHLTEYERPHDRDLAHHRAWLELMQTAAAEALGVPLDQTFLKQRRKNTIGGQYQKLNQLGDRLTVQENQLQFLVNLSDYVDTGLFLDHRIARKMVMGESAGKRVLNLFAYTGAFSVYAAAGGAATTTTVDLSKTYLDWARDNFQINHLLGPKHQFIASDSIEFLQSAASRGWKFDLVIFDPPTYSNSKRTELDWDVQADYLRVFQALRPVTTGGTVIYFSTNFRRFKFDDAEVKALGFVGMEISKQTVPEDFRNRRIHRCWRLNKVN